MSLDASPRRVFSQVTLPLVMPGVLAGAALAFATSLDEVVLTIDFRVDARLKMHTNVHKPPCPPPESTHTQKVPIWLLANFTLSGTFGMHLLVPALPGAAIELGTNSSSIQQTIGVYIFGLAIGKLVHGPLSDHFGRRPVLMAGLVLHITAGIACFLPEDISTLVIARLFQALGGCAGLVLSRAIVRDTAVHDQVAKRMVLMNLFVVLGPAVAPIIGFVIADMLGWRSIFAVLLAFVR